MNKTPFISIIIPIYKVEKYVRGTLDSIYSQKFDENEFEVICVNDGTPDNSMQIVNEFALTHPNIHIINQENQGLSCARNAGLEIAQGDYVWFVDSDDKVSADSLTKLQQIIVHNSNIEIFALNLIRVDERTMSKNEEKFLPKTKYHYLYGQTLCFKQIVGKFIKTPVQRYLLKKNFLMENALSFYPGIYHEDEEFVPRAVFAAKSIQCVDFAPYLYLIRYAGSITSNVSARKINDKIKILSLLRKYSFENTKNYEQKLYFDFYIFILTCDILAEISNKSDGIDNTINNKKIYFRKQIIKGIVASIYWGLWKQVIRGIPLFLFPSLGTTIEQIRRRLKNE